MPPFAQPFILNVDGNEACRDAATRALEDSGFRVATASSGAEALRMASADSPDLVLLAARLPDTSGIEACRLLKSGPETSRIPIIYLAGSCAERGDAATGLESGADGVLAEPVQPEVLVATINAALRARRAEESARLLVREWETTFDSIGDGVALADTQGRIVRLNHSFGRLVSPPQVGGSAGFDVLWGHLPAVREPFAKALQNRSREALEVVFESKILEITVDPIFDEARQVTGAVCIASDVTGKRRLEEQFRESQKFETIGTLAAGVAHDFNNLLTGILGNASLILGELPPDSPFRERLEDVVHSSQRAADLTRQLLAYSGKARHYMQRVDLSGLVAGFRGLFEAAVPKKVTLTVSLAPGMPRIDADPSQIEQTVLNLVSNAAEAIGENAGEIRVETGMADGGVFLEVRDTGSGMEAETKARIFDPFFTTKFTGRGLGLAAVAGIVRVHKGSIQVTSTPGQGSTFRISFPPAEPSPAVPAAQPAAKARPDAAQATVLVVDDEEMVRRMAEATLRIRGYRVLLASDGLEAIAQVREHAEIDVVLLDFTMPVMGGEEAIDSILKARPDLRVIVSTGYDQSETAARFGEKAVGGFLQKPYTSRQLAAKIESVLAR